MKLKLKRRNLTIGISFSNTEWRQKLSVETKFKDIFKLINSYFFLKFFQNWIDQNKILDNIVKENVSQKISEVGGIFI